jgi:hypothetical protein
MNSLRLNSDRSSLTTVYNLIKIDPHNTKNKPKKLTASNYKSTMEFNRFRCRYRSIIFACFYLYISVVNLIDYLDIDKMMDINSEKC